MRNLRTGILQRVSRDENVFKIIKGRFYPAELATIRDPEFPCANFRIDGGSPIDSIKELKSIRLLIWTWSKKSFQEAIEVFKAIENCLVSNIIEYGGSRLIIRLTTVPIEAYDETFGTYSTRSVWAVHLIE